MPRVAVATAAHLPELDEDGPALLAALALVTAGLLRYPWAYALGWVVQAGALALGLVTAAMFALGLVFGALWVLALVLGRRVEVLKAQREVGP